MNVITLDPDLRAKLNGLNEHLEVQDGSGKIVGHFLPDAIYTRLIYAWAKLEFADEAEHKLAMSEPGGMTTAEAIAFVHQLASNDRGTSR